MIWRNIQRNKQYIIAFTCAGVLFWGCTQTFAWGIPGVTKPLDSANYWTADTISWADSAPSVYTLRDLAKNGGNIIDYQNLQPNTVKDLKAAAEFSKRLEELLTELKNIARLDELTIDTFQKYLQTLQEGSTIIENAMESEMSTTQVSAKGLDEKYQNLDVAYQQAFAVIKNEMHTYDERSAVLKEALKHINKAEGRVAAMQSQTEIGAFAAAEVQTRNRLLAQRNALIALHNRVENDEVIRAEITMRNKLEMAFADPYHPSAYDRAVYQKTAVNGMPDFQ